MHCTPTDLVRQACASLRAVIPLLFCASTIAAEPEAGPPVAPERVVITGNPLASLQPVRPSSVLTGDQLLLQRAGTLGDTLAAMPGVAASGFGPQSSRPVIRGLDGDRVRLLDNGGASVDASALSYDHAAAIDPLVVERLEVLRGPAALLYGGSATGGVVNAIDNRIPQSPIDALTGRAELRAFGAADERAGAVVLEAGGRGLAWHADVARRRSSDLRVPRYTPYDNGVALPPTDHVRNSAGDARSGALGASWTDAHGYVGASVDGYRNDYGVTVEPDVTIRMRRDRWSVGGERRNTAGPIEGLDFHASHTHYQHQEVEASGEVGTIFDNRGDELRMTLRHAPWRALRGVFGVQAERLDAAALGAEAFVPDTRTQSAAMFVLEEATLDAWTFSGGARVEHATVASAGDPKDATEPRFGTAAERDYTPASASLAVSWAWTPRFTLQASVAHTERAPTYYELYANGLHVATGAYERGDATLGLERSDHVELGARWLDAARQQQLQINLFDARFANYFALDATGRQIVVPGEDGGVETVPEYAFSAVPARLWGLEAEGRTPLVRGDWTLDLNAGLDWLRGENRSTGEPLPRLPPWRLRGGLEGSHGPWRAGLQLRHAAAQHRVPADDIATPGYTLVDLWASWHAPWFDAGDALLFAKLENATDTLAYNATALRTARELSPLGGRAFTLGLRVSF